MPTKQQNASEAAWYVVPGFWVGVLNPGCKAFFEVARELQVLSPKKPLRVWLLEPETSNIGYLDPLGVLSICSNPHVHITPNAVHTWKRLHISGRSLPPYWHHQASQPCPDSEQLKLSTGSTPSWSCSEGDPEGPSTPFRRSLVQ